MPALFPTHSALPGSYPPAVIKSVRHTCTVKDIADFVVDFIISDNLGLIANTHLLLSDRRSRGVEDPDCIRLAELHSTAVDFPKSGTPVPMAALANLIPKVKPDWDAGEMSSDSTRYYVSEKALGRLYREVKMFDAQERGESVVNMETHYVDNSDIEELLRSPTPEENKRGNPISKSLRPAILKYIDANYTDDDATLAKSQFLAFETELRHISMNHTLSLRSKPLKEAEIFVGTIFAKTSQ
jgi:RNA-dependent RNA polymerase